MQSDVSLGAASFSLCLCKYPKSSFLDSILGQAAIDSAFRQRLLEDPPTALAAEGFELTPEEQEAFTRFSALPFPEFFRHLLEELGPDAGA